MKRNRFTPDEAARQMNEASDAGIRDGRAAKLGSWPDSPYGWHEKWLVVLDLAYRRAFEEGQRQRRAELTQVASEELNESGA